MLVLTIDKSYPANFGTNPGLSFTPFGENLPNSTLVDHTVVSSNKINTRVLKLLDDFETLNPNWDGEDAKAPSKDVIFRVRNLVRLLSKTGQPVFHTAPGPNGEVMIDIRNEDQSLEIIFYSQKAFFVKFPYSGVPEQGKFDEENISDLLSWLNG